MLLLPSILISGKKPYASPSTFHPDFWKEAMRAIHFSHMKYSNRFGRTFIGLALVLLLFPSLTSSCTEQECTSLLRFLGGLSQDGNLTLTWKNGTDCCTWEGITCRLAVQIGWSPTSSWLRGTFRDQSHHPLAISLACCT